ncbi:hypothetical protein ACF0H5_006750 [Mactra antiquata]
MDIHLILICLLYRLVVCEPQCSKFDYEEKTLEKMIRTEILVEQIVSDIKQLKQQTNDAVLTVEKMKTELGVNFQNMHSENALKLEEYKNTMSEWKDLLEIKPDVLFLAKDPTTQSPSTNAPIIFGTTMYDLSQSYDNTTGAFTSPVDGMYAFTTQMCLAVGTGKWVNYAIVANGQYVANSLTYDNSYRFCNTAQAFVFLKKGYQVYVTARTRSSSSLRANHDHEWCTFSGMLIH